MKQANLQEILQGYMRFFKSCLQIVLFGGVIIVAAAAISLPLWYWATHNRTSFNIFVICVIAAGLIIMVVRKLRSSVETSLSKGGSRTKTLLRPLGKIIRLLITIVLVYSVVFLFSMGQPFAAVPVAVFSFLLIGLLYFRPKTG